MANYTIRLNLGGNLVSELERANRSADQLERRTFSYSVPTASTTAGVVGGAMASRAVDRRRYQNIPESSMNRLGRFYRSTSRFSGQSESQFYGRINTAFRDFGRFRENFSRNMFSFGGMRRNVGNFVSALGSFNSAITRAVPMLQVAQIGVAGYAAGFALTKILPALVGGLTYSVGSRVLNSQNMTQAIANRMQFTMAERGLGSQYGTAIQDASQIAGQYGFSRSGVLNAINVLSGFRTERGEVGYTEATDLARIIGKVSQIGGRPYDVVSLNLQQILAAERPNMRDIREILGQAPILSKYALQEMARLNQTGDPREYLQNRDNLLRALYRLDQDVEAPPAARARGRITMQRENFWMAVSSMDNLWDMIGETGQRIYDVLTRRINEFSNTFNEGNLQGYLDTFVRSIDSLLDIATGAIKVVGGIGRWASDNSNFIQSIFNPVALFQGNHWIQAIAKDRRLRRQRSVADRVYSTSREEVNTYLGGYINPYVDAMEVPEWASDANSWRARQRERLLNSTLRNFAPNINEFTESRRLHDLNNAGFYQGQLSPLMPLYSQISPQAINEFLRSQTSTNSLSSGGAALNDMNEIETLTRGNRSLIINFQAPLSENNVTINQANNPEAIIARLIPEIEERVQRGLHDAIAGASRMGGNPSFSI